MYRQYENPRELERLYIERQDVYNQLVKDGCLDDGYLYEMFCELQELKDRICQAWLDEEYDMTNAEGFDPYYDFEG